MSGIPFSTAPRLLRIFGAAAALSLTLLVGRFAGLPERNEPPQTVPSPHHASITGAPHRQISRAPARRNREPFPRFHRWSGPGTPYEAWWGPYVVRVEQFGADDSGSPQRLIISDRKGHVLHEIRDFAIIAVDLVELTGRAPAELHVACWSGGAYASFTDFYFTREGGLHNILTFRGNDLGIREIRDLNHDGVAEVITESPLLKYFSAYNFHRHYPVSTVLTWDGSRFVDSTRRYNWWALQEARARRAKIMQFSYESEWERQDVISAYYANMMAAGRRRQARLWLAHHLPASEWRWVRRHERELRAIVASAAWRSGRPVQTRLVDLTESPLP